MGLSNDATAAPDDSAARGRQAFERVMGVSADGFLEQINSLAPEYGQKILEWEFADGYGRAGLDLKTRELVIIASCATLGAVGHPAVRMHVSAALRAGATPAE